MPENELQARQNSKEQQTRHEKGQGMGQNGMQKTILIPRSYTKKFGQDVGKLCNAKHETNFLLEPGSLLEEGACTLYRYKPTSAPLPPQHPLSSSNSELTKTIVYCRISQEKVRKVDDKKKQ